MFEHAEIVGRWLVGAADRQSGAGFRFFWQLGVTEDGGDSVEVGGERHSVGVAGKRVSRQVTEIQEATSGVNSARGATSDDAVDDALPRWWHDKIGSGLVHFTRAVIVPQTCQLADLADATQARTLTRQ